LQRWFATILGCGFLPILAELCYSLPILADSCGTLQLVLGEWVAILFDREKEV